MKYLEISFAFLIVLALSLTGLSCSKTGTNTQDTASPSPSASATATNVATSNLTNTDASTADSLMVQNYELARTKAASWKPDAVLVAVQVKLPLDLSVNKANETFIFGSASDTNNWWSFSVSEQSGKFVRAIIPKEDYLGTDIKPIQTKYWKMNYAKAFQLADAAGGSAFRNNNPDTQVTQTLRQMQPNGWLWWEVEYKSPTNKLILKVNPNDANIVDESGNPVSATGSNSGQVTGGAENNTGTATPTTSATSTSSAR